MPSLSSPSTKPTPLINCSPVSIIIINYNSGEFLVRCVRSVIDQVDEIIIVDNASTDTSLDRVETPSYDHANLKVIRNSENLGFAAACNIGILQSTNEIILFLNPDCQLDGDAVAEMYRALMRTPEIGMVGGLLVNSDGSEQPGGRRAVPTPWRSFVRAFGLSRLSNRWPKLFTDFDLHQQPLPDQPIDVEAISGACMMVKQTAINDVGLWDEQYFLHCEDLDWCMRFQQKGWDILFVPSARVEHEHGGCSQNRPIFVEWHKHKGMTRFYRKFFKHQYPLGLMGLVSLGVWLRFAAVSVYRTGKSIKMKFKTPT